MVIMDLLSKRAITVSAAVLALSLSACETTPTTKPVSIDSTAVADADFSSYKSYYVLPVPPGKDGVTPAKPFSRVTVEKAVRGELGARNYVETADKEAADMLVAIQFSLKDETTYKNKTTYEIRPNLYSGYGTGYGRSYGGGYGRSYGGSYGNSYGRSGYGGASGLGRRGYGNYSYGYGYSSYYGYDTIPRTTVVAEDFRQGNMIIDIIDPKSNAVVWEGHASGEGEHEAAKIEARVNMVVGRLFGRYPHTAAGVNPVP